MTYTPAYFRKCGIKNDGQIIRHGAHPTHIPLLPFRSVRTELALIRSKFLCKECNMTFNAQTNLVEENCPISKELKQQFALYLAKNISSKDITERYFVSDVAVSRVMLTCWDTYKPNFNYLPAAHCFDEFKSMKSCSGKMSFVYMDGQANKWIGVSENRRLAFLKAYFLKFIRKTLLKVKYIVMDMNAPYFVLVHSIFLNAQIVTDRFHIIQQITRSLNQLRIQTMNKCRKDDSLFRAYRNGCTS